MMRSVVLQVGVTPDRLVRRGTDDEDRGKGTSRFGPMRRPPSPDLVGTRTFPAGTAIDVDRAHGGTR